MVTVVFRKDTGARGWQHEHHILKWLIRPFVRKYWRAKTSVMHRKECSSTMTERENALTERLMQEHHRVEISHINSKSKFEIRI